ASGKLKESRVEKHCDDFASTFTPLASSRMSEEQESCEVCLTLVVRNALSLLLPSGLEVLFSARRRVRFSVFLFDKKVTWLILPVVICLSQRLSHACLSINNFIL